MPLACSHVLTVTAKHTQNKNSLNHLHVLMWNPKRLPVMNKNHIAAFQCLICGRTYMKLGDTEVGLHRAQLPCFIFKKHSQLLQASPAGYKEKWQEVGFCQLKTLCHSTHWKWNGLAKRVQEKVDQWRRLEQVMLRWVSKWPTARQGQCQQPCTKCQHQKF